MHNLTVARMNTGMSIGDLAEKSGVPRETISRFENGHSRPRATTIYKLGQALGVRPSDLLGEVSATHEAQEPTGTESPEEAAAEIERLGDPEVAFAFALAWAGSGPDALDRLDTLSGAISREERPLTWCGVRALYYGIEWARKGEASEEKLAKVGA